MGLDIIAQVESKKPDLAPWASEAREREGAVIEEIVAQLATENPMFHLTWVTLRALAAAPNKDTSEFKSREEYDAYFATLAEDRDGYKGIRTLNGDFVKSMEEANIANWLFVNGVSYQYEKSYEQDTADTEHRQYHPDFYYPEINCYHEHFALDRQGRPPAFFSGDYAEGVKWKRALHAERGTGLIETTSAMYRDDILFSHLEAQLKSRGQKFQVRSAGEIEERLSDLRVAPIARFVRTFITLAKSNELTPATLGPKVALQGDRFRARLFVDAIGPIFDAYEARLRALGCIDFEDMILIAARYVEESRYIHPYRLILVDEFQDISRCRARLVQAMLKQAPDCRLFAVGDDWQSIYRFTGADQNIMLEFEKMFGVTHTSYLTQTFRSNQGIADVASVFVQKNPKQMRKKIRAANPRTASTVHILEYDRDEDVSGMLEREIATLARHAHGRGAKIKILVLGRYNRERPSDLPKWQKTYSESVDLSFLTLHRSKGLEADYVFILGANSGKYGFPSDVGDDPLLELVLPAPESFKAAEERRLFYVGITRARHRCHILTKRGKSSPFVPELLTSGGAAVYRMGSPQPVMVRAEPCTKCAGGVLREKSGEHGAFLGCSNYPRCKHTKRLN